MRKFLFRRNNKTLLEKSILEIQQIRSNSDILAICAKPTGYSWLGVNIATISLFPKITWQIPQYFSNSVFSENELFSISNCINDLNFNQVIFSGYPPYFAVLVSNIETKTKVIYHGFLSELSENKVQQEALKSINQLAASRKISAVGFVKKGLANSMKNLFSLDTYEIVLPNRKIAEKAIRSNKKPTIGCFVSSAFRKNLHNQAVAALMAKETELHVLDTNELSYLPQDRIIYHTLTDHSSFIDLLGSMTINLHVTFSESWGQVLAESISQGVPCLASYTSSFFDYDPDLKQELIVDGFDDSMHIYRKIVSVLDKKDILAPKCIEYAHKLNSISEEKLNEFINA